MKKLIIIGGDGHGTVISSCIKDNELFYGKKEWNIIGFINDYEEIIDSYPVVGGTQDIDKFVNQEDCYFAWGIHLIGRNPLTKQVFDRMNIPLERLVTIIHHSAFIAENVKLHPGVLVMAHSYIGARTELGVGTMVKANTCIGHDVKSGPLCHFAMGSITGSYTSLGLCADIAIGATTLEYIKIGDYAMAGARSLVTHNIPDREIHIGTPACYFRNIKED